ncbi:serine/threonine-protein kinase 11-interacting protein isoform X2 [Toxorhynchites rutilus septentrionalis]|uniref:serine/threonine-protein kinase 11-interacting protein isoform X2 n=1 Tax=Toxorhynchites rutilus septentrionalis TaxID=329112 RepID=UPI00247AB5AE|nr:serine/threonine-protein kinase 11-interacting protein isoform X2 [Toxorhynchites rutilus septentrionalis]
MDPKQITALAKLLRESGDKVLNYEYKLSLSGSLLRALNDSFSLIIDKNELLPPQSFQVVKPNNAKSGVFRDIQFIYDFVQKTVILSLNQFINDDLYEFEVDITKFRNLRKLEIQKIPISQIVGIQQIRSQINEITCIRSISHVKDIVTSCGGDNSNGFTWNELRSANFSYNMLDYIDSSLEFTPWLENLNLSHNQIVSVPAIKWLPNLRVLNLSFNRLTHIPSFHQDALKKLQVFHISNNFIEDLSGVSRLLGLSDLDLSGNCMIDHTVLLPVSTLSALSCLNLKDNPLACHPKHRQATARYLNKNVAGRKFLLDVEPLSKYEKTLVGNYDSYRAILVPRSPGSVTSSAFSTPTNKSVINTPTGSLTSRSSFNMDLRDAMSASIVSQRRIKVRRAVISDNDMGDANQHLESKAESDTVAKGLETNQDHLETKKQIESLRKQYGSEWLQNQAGDMVKNVIGYDSSVEKIYESAMHYENEIQIMKKNDHSQASERGTVDSILVCNSNETEHSIRTSTPEERDRTVLMEPCGSPIARQFDGRANESDFKSVNNESDSNYQSVNDTTGETTRHSLDLNNIYGNAVELETDSDDDDNAVSYTVKIKGNSMEIDLSVSEAWIREKYNEKTKTRWSIKTLEACERSTSTNIILLFDTIKKDKKMRTYESDEQSCQRLEKQLREMLSKRPLSEMNQKLFKCVVCNAKFSREIDTNKTFDDLQCPECNGGYCIEIKDSPPKRFLATNDSTKSDIIVRTDETNESAPAMAGASGLGATFKKSDSKSSIVLSDAWRSPIIYKPRSAGSLNDSSSCSRISQTSSSCDSNQSVAGSTNSERDRDLDLLGNESDIEILSNPSQSSIEVLSRGFIPSRKHSEDNQSIQVKDEETMHDDSATTLISQETSTHDLMTNPTNSDIPKIECPSNTVNTDVTLNTTKSVLSQKKSFLTGVNLTESSSSGSVTDSVCTAYESIKEQKQGTSSGSKSDGDISKKDAQAEKSVAKLESSMIGTMLGGIIQSTNMLMSRTPKLNKADSSLKLTFEPMRYSYTDFANVDHRLKLYLYQNLFEDANESLKWLVSCVIFNENQLDEWPTGFDGLFIMSTTKFYVMKKVAAENDDPSTWLKKHISGTIDRVGIAQVLPWKIGMKFYISAIGGIHIILQDILRTDCLILFFADNPLPEYCTFDSQSSEILMGKLNKATKGDIVKILTMVNFCDVLSDDVLQSMQMSTLLLTDNHLYLATDIKWLNENSKYQIEPKYTQLMSNLVELEDINDLSCRLNFMDEQEDKYETWRIDFATGSAKESTVSTICNLWEKIFGVPLISCNNNSKCNNSGNDNNNSTASDQVDDSNSVSNNNN